MAIKTKRMSDWLAQNGEAITNVTKESMRKYMESNLSALEDGVFIGKFQNDGWGTQTGNEYANIGSYFRCERWQQTEIGIKQADADAIVIQFGGYRLGIALKEGGALSWGSKKTSESLGYKVNNDLASMDGREALAAIMASSYFKDDDPATYACAYCYNYSTSRMNGERKEQIGKHQWWLPTMGELSLIHEHFETINLALQRIKDAGKQSVDLLQRTNYWSCQESWSPSAWFLDFSHGARGYDGKVGSKFRVRPVTAF